MKIKKQFEISLEHGDFLPSKISKKGWVVSINTIPSLLLKITKRIGPKTFLAESVKIKDI